MYLGKFTDITVNPAVEPVSVEEFKNFLHVESGDDDALIALLLQSARISAELYMNRPIINTTFKQVQNGFEFDGVNQYSTRDLIGLGQGIEPLDFGQPYIGLQKKRIQSVTSVKTYNNSNTEAVFASENYIVDAVSGKILINDSANLPSNIRSLSGIEVIYVAGFGSSASSVPEAIKTAIKIHTQSLYDYNRPNQNLVADAYALPAGAKTLLQQYKVMSSFNG
jgi:hypothetical protein